MEDILVAVDVPLVGDERRKNWAKVVRNVDPSKASGWAFEGDFIAAGGIQDVPAGAIILVYGERGSRNNPAAEAARLHRQRRRHAVCRGAGVRSSLGADAARQRPRPSRAGYSNSSRAPVVAAAHAVLRRRHPSRGAAAQTRHVAASFSGETAAPALRASLLPVAEALGSRAAESERRSDAVPGGRRHEAALPGPRYGTRRADGARVPARFDDVARPDRTFGWATPLCGGRSPRLRIVGADCGRAALDGAACRRSGGRPQRTRNRNRGRHRIVDGRLRRAGLRAAPPRSHAVAGAHRHTSGGDTDEGKAGSRRHGPERARRRQAGACRQMSGALLRLLQRRVCGLGSGP